MRDWEKKLLEQAKEAWDNYEGKITFEVKASPSKGGARKRKWWIHGGKTVRGGEK